MCYAKNFGAKGYGFAGGAAGGLAGNYDGKIDFSSYDNGYNYDDGEQEEYRGNEQEYGY